MEFLIETDNPALLKELRTNAPAGVDITPLTTGIQTRSDPFSMIGEVFNIAVNINPGEDILNLTLSLLVLRKLFTKGKHYIHINGKRISLNSPEEVQAELDKAIKHKNENNY